MELPPRPSLFDFHGVSMTNYFTSNWDNVQNFRARPEDILIATYPKAGTTWVSYILDLVYFGQMIPERQVLIPIDERVPFMEYYLPGAPSGLDEVSELTTSPRLIKTHLPVQFIPKSFWEEDCKIIYVARNPKDNAVSYFHFDRMNMFQPEPGDWNSFLRRFMEGKMVFGSWYEHVKGWWDRKQNNAHILYLFYEDLVEDTEKELERLCVFLGVSPSPDQKQTITQLVHFDNMKNNKMANLSTVQCFDFNISPFLRKGKVSDWKNHFTVAQNEQFDEDYKKKMENTRLQFRTTL